MLADPNSQRGGADHLPGRAVPTAKLTGGMSVCHASHAARKVS